MLPKDPSRRRLCALALATATTAPLAQVSRRSDEKGPAGFVDPSGIADYMSTMRLGTQAGDYLEMAYEPAAQRNYVGPADFDNMRRDAHFDHVRIPANCAARANVAGVVAEAFLQKLDRQVEWALARFERVVLDPLHHYLQWKGDYRYAQAFDDSAAVAALDSAGHAVRATAIWVQLARRYRDTTTRLSFDLINEPTSGKPEAGRPAGISAADLNAWYASVIPAIRAVGGRNEQRVIWLEPWGNMLDRLVVPTGVGPVGVSPHYYSPFGFTHQADRLNGPGMANFVEDMRYARRWGRNNKVAIWIGEAGVSRNLSTGTVPRLDTERAEYTAMIRACALEYGQPVCYWGYNAAFAQYDQAARAWYPHMLQALTAQPAPYPVRPLPSFTYLKGGRLSREFYINGVWKGFAYDPATGVLATPANDTGSDQQVNLVFPDIAVGTDQSWIVRATEFTGHWTIGSSLFSFEASRPNQNGVAGLDVRVKNANGKDNYPRYRPVAPGGFDNAYGPFAPETNAFLGANLVLAAGSPPGRIALACIRST